MRRTLTRTSSPSLSSLRRMVPQLALANGSPTSPIGGVAQKLGPVGWDKGGKLPRFCTVRVAACGTAAADRGTAVVRPLSGENRTLGGTAHTAPHPRPVLEPEVAEVKKRYRPANLCCHNPIHSRDRACLTI
jgi:hypothetical protein